MFCKGMFGRRKGEAKVLTAKLASHPVSSAHPDSFCTSTGLQTCSALVKWAPCTNAETPLAETKKAVYIINYITSNYV
jgi:hypothetical protein